MTDRLYRQAATILSPSPFLSPSSSHLQPGVLCCSTAASARESRYDDGLFPAAGAAPIRPRVRRRTRHPCSVSPTSQLSPTSLCQLAAFVRSCMLRTQAGVARSTMDIAATPARSTARDNTRLNTRTTRPAADVQRRLAAADIDRRERSADAAPPRHASQQGVKLQRPHELMGFAAVDTTCETRE